MYALVTDGTITKYFNNPKGFTLGDLQYPKDIFMKWSVSEKEAIGIYEVVFNDSNKKDEQWYINTNQSFAFANGVVTASYGTATAKAYADTNWTQKQIDDGNAPTGVDTNTVANRGLKYNLIQTLKQQVAGILNDTDWYITRNAEKETAIPSAISTHRDAVRTKQASMETAITNANDTPALETLYTYTEQEDGTVTKPLGELPTLEI